MPTASEPRVVMDPSGEVNRVPLTDALPRLSANCAHAPFRFYRKSPGWARLRRHHRRGGRAASPGVGGRELAGTGAVGERRRAGVGIVLVRTQDTSLPRPADDAPGRPVDRAIPGTPAVSRATAAAHASSSPDAATRTERIARRPSRPRPAHHHRSGSRGRGSRSRWSQRETGGLPPRGAGSCGRRKVNVAPLPSPADSAVMSPP